MKNNLGLLGFILIGVMSSAMDAQALLLQGPGEVYAAYPQVLSTPIDVLPQGFITINVGYETFYYYSGMFYQRIMRDQKYVAVPPPIGAVVFNIPQGYQFMLIDGMSYYEYQGVYYKRVLEGYKVTFPPV